MSKTAWSRSASSIPSDCIQPSRAFTPKQNKGKGKNSQPPKSKEVLRLESLVEGLKSQPSGKDTKGGCFCQAREHPVSKYTPICLRCGLVLCSLHEPFYSCPHCASPLTSPISRDELIQRLTDELSQVMVREAEQRKVERQELEKAAGAFPTLATSTGNNQPSTATQQPRKVLSLNAQTRTIIVASYMATPVPTLEVKEELRVPPPPRDIDNVRNKPLESRRWQNLRDSGIAYVCLPAQSTAEGSRSGRRKKKGADSRTI